MTAIALIVTDLEQSALGLPSRLEYQLADCSVLEHTVRRALRIEGINKVVLVHRPGQNPGDLIGDLPVQCIAVDGFDDPMAHRWRVARKWSPRAWRGGLGGTTVFDECLPAGVLVAAMKQADAMHAIVLRGEWCLIDPKLCTAVLNQHVANPQAMKVCFTQAPPGICGVALSRSAAEQLHEHHAGFANVLGYNPAAPQPDPIGKDVNLPISSDIRDTYHRLIYDLPRSCNLIDRIAEQLSDELDEADADTITRTARELGEDPALLPDFCTLELTPRRSATGPITPQHYNNFERDDIDPNLAQRICEQLPEDTCLMLGGLGDALLHPQWELIVRHAQEAAVLAIGIETDLLCETESLEHLLELPIELIVVRLNADRAQTYEQVMGQDGFKRVLDNLQWLFTHRNKKSNDDKQLPGGIPWIVPSMVKTSQTLTDMEGFFDKWVMVSGHAIVDGPRCGCGLMPDMNVVNMTPPNRIACRQLGRRLSILSDGRVALCDQDWQGRSALGDTHLAPLEEIWAVHRDAVTAHHEQRFAELTLCSTCNDWHRP